HALRPQRRAIPAAEVANDRRRYRTCETVTTKFKTQSSKCKHDPRGADSEFCISVLGSNHGCSYWICCFRSSDVAVGRGREGLAPDRRSRARATAGHPAQPQVTAHV